MAITLRSQREIELMRKAGVVLAGVLSQLQEAAEPGASTGELNEIATKMVSEAGVIALFKGVKNPYADMPFPGVICASLNEQVVHGIPSKDVILREGDILSIDFGVKLDGYCADAAVTFAIGEIPLHKQKLIEVTKEVLDIAVKESAPSVKWSTIAGEMQKKAESAGFSIVRDFVGHGIGTEMHEEPRVPNFVNDDLLNDDIILTEGMVIAVEPMITEGSYKVKTLKDGWTVVTKDNKCSAHFEHTIAVVENGSQVLTI